VTLNMRVLHLVSSVSPICGGPTQAVLGACRSLRAWGVDAVIATTNAHMHEPSPLGDCVEWEGVPVHFFAHQSPPMYALSYGLTRWLDQNVRRFDVVHAHSVFSYCTTAGSFYARKYGVPYIVAPEGTLDSFPLRKSAFRKRIYLALIERHLLQGAAALDFKTAFEETSVDKLGLSVPRVVIPIGVSEPEAVSVDSVTAFRKRHLLDGRFTLLSLSRLDPIKGIDLVIEALAKLRFPNYFRLLVAGSGDKAYEKTLRDLVNARGLRSVVEFVGLLRGHDKQMALASADAFVLSSYHENFGLAVAEAMQAGLPVIVSDKVGLSSLVYKSGSGLVTKCSPDHIASGLLRMAEEEPLRRKMGENGKRLAKQQFDWNTIAKQMVAVYDDVTRESKATRGREAVFPPKLRQSN
jgi:glycosyltransferase involved in cell wall biosynthesis